MDFLKTIFILLAVNFTMPLAFPDDEPICEPPAVSLPLKLSSDMERFLTQKAPAAQSADWFAATSDQIRSAPCRRNGPPTLAEMAAHIQAIDANSPSNERQSRTIHGIAFEDESPQLLDLFEKLTTYEDGAGAGRKTNQKTFQSPCKKVICAAKQLFGEKESSALLYMLDRYELNGSHLASPGADAWKFNELEDVLMGVSDLPRTVMPFQKNKRLIRYKRGSVPPTYGANHEVYANSVIEILDKWDTLSLEQRQMTILHELGHNLGSDLGIIKSAQWLRLSGWKTKTLMREIEVKESGKTVKKQVNESFMAADNLNTIASRYGLNNPDEDFAEAIVAYRYNPQRLKERSPEKYELLKEAVFDGLEYTSDGTCDENNSMTRRLAIGAGFTLRGPAQVSPYVDAVKKTCGEWIIPLLAKPPISATLDARSSDCIAREITKEMAADIAKRDSFRYPEFTRAALAMRRYPPMSASFAAKATQRVRDDFKAALRDVLSSQDREVDPLYLEKGSYKNLPTKSFCAKWTGAHPAADRLRTEFDDTKTLAVFRNSETVKKFFLNSCLAIQGTKMPHRAMTSDEIDKALTLYIP